MEYCWWSACVCGPGQLHRVGSLVLQNRSLVLAGTILILRTQMLPNLHQYSHDRMSQLLLKLLSTASHLILRLAKLKKKKKSQSNKCGNAQCFWTHCRKISNTLHIHSANEKWFGDRQDCKIHPLELKRATGKLGNERERKTGSQEWRICYVNDHATGRANFFLDALST